MAIDTEDGAIGVSPFAATDGPNDRHWIVTGKDKDGRELGQLHPGLGADSPALKRVNQHALADGQTIAEATAKISAAQAEIQREREAFKAEVAAFQKAQEAAAQKKGKKAAAT